MKVVKQRDLKDCGVCSLQSIISHYGGYVSLEKLRIDTNTTKDGTNAYNLIKAAKSYGFDSYGIKLDKQSLSSENIVLPAIAHLHLETGLDHFVVIYKINKTKLTIMDPSKGKVIISRQEFLNLWTHIIILFHPQHKIIKYDKEKKLRNLFLEIVKNQYKCIRKLIITSLLLTMVSILTNYYFKIGLNAITNNIYLNSLKYIMLLFFILTIFKIMFQHLRTYFENHLNKNIDIHLFTDFFNHLFNLPLNIIQSRSLGEIVTRVNELNDLKILFTEFFVTVFLDSILAISSMVLLLIISKELFFILCIALLFYLLIGIIFYKINYRKIMQNIEKEADFNTTLIENLNMINSIKNLNTTANNITKVENKLLHFVKDNFIITNFMNKQKLIKLTINEITLFVINTIGFYLIKNKQLTIVDLITFNSLMGFYFESIKNTIDMLPKVSYLKAAYYKLNDFLSNDIEKLNDLYETMLNNDITIKNLDYSYNGYQKIFDNLNLSIKAREHVFLKGNSGSGKSTICKMIYRLINANKGNIIIGGVSISDYNLNTIRNNITYLSQNENIYTDTIRENIIFNRKIDLSEFIKVCKICKLESVVAKRPLRYESLISDDTNLLSGGEKQRVVLARALLKSSKILILDEALSEVDYKLEADIIKNILETYKEKTIIYISHKNHEKLFDRTIFIKGINEY